MVKQGQGRFDLRSVQLTSNLSDSSRHQSGSGFDPVVHSVRIFMTSVSFLPAAATASLTQFSTAAAHACFSYMSSRPTKRKLVGGSSGDTRIMFYKKQLVSNNYVIFVHFYYNKIRNT